MTDDDEPSTGDSEFEVDNDEYWTQVRAWFASLARWEILGRSNRFPNAEPSSEERGKPEKEP